MQSLASTDGGRSRRRAADLIRRTRTYRAAHRREVPRLCALARKVESYHADDPAAPHGLAELLRQTWDELEDHMRRQERLIPSLLRQAAGSEERCAEMRRDLARHAARTPPVGRRVRCGDAARGR